MTAQTPIEFYHSVLESLDYQADSQGAVSYKHGVDNLSPEIIDGRRLVIPTPEILRTISSDKNVIAFHPLCENITMGESLIIRRLKYMVAQKISLMLTVLGESLLRIATEKGPLTAETTELGKVLANATPKTIEHFVNIINNTDQVKHAMTAIYIKRKGTLNREQYRRVAVVRFPIMEEWDDGKPDNEVFGVKISKKDKVTIGELFKFMLKDICVPNGYSMGTNSASAPNFVALMLAFNKIASELSAHAISMKSKINKPMLLPKLQWTQQLDDLSIFMGVIPPLLDNEGESETANANQAIQSTLAPPVAIPTVQTLQPPQQPVGRYATTNTVQHTPQQQAVVAAQPQQAMYPQQATYPTMAPQQVQPQMQPDFASMVTQQVYANNPAMQMQQPMYPQQMQQPMYPQQMPMMQPQMPMMPGMPGMPFPGMMPNQMGGMPMMPGMPGTMPGTMPMYPQQQQPMMPVNYVPGQGAGKYQTA